MLEIEADGSFNFAIDSLGYWSGKGSSCVYFKNNSIYMGWDRYEKQIYFSLEVHIGRLRIKADT